MKTPRPEVQETLHRLRFQRFLNLTGDIPKVKGECAWCGAPSSLKYCGHECSAEAYIRRGSAEASAQVKTRDDGVCAGCGMDCHWLSREFGRIERVTKRHRWNSISPKPDEMDRAGFRMAWGPWVPSGWHDGSKSLALSFWEADHIVPVSEGGGCCGLDNYQTLCLRCHKAETAQLARKTALRRQAEKAPTLFPQEDLEASLEVSDASQEPV